MQPFGLFCPMPTLLCLERNVNPFFTRVFLLQLLFLHMVCLHVAWFFIPFHDISSCLQLRSSSTTLTIVSQLGETKSSSVEQSVSRRMNTVLTRRVLVRPMSWTFLRVQVSARVIPTILFHKEGYVPLSYSLLHINTKTQLRSLHWQMRKITNV